MGAVPCARVGEARRYRWCCACGRSPRRIPRHITRGAVLPADTMHETGVSRGSRMCGGMRSKSAGWKAQHEFPRVGRIRHQPPGGGYLGSQRWTCTEGKQRYRLCTSTKAQSRVIGVVGENLARWWTLNFTQHLHSSSRWIYQLFCTPRNFTLPFTREPNSAGPIYAGGALRHFFILSAPPSMVKSCPVTKPASIRYSAASAISLGLPARFVA